MTDGSHALEDRTTFAEALREVGLHLAARGVLVGGTAAIEDAALEAIALARGGSRTEPHVLFGDRLRARGLRGPAADGRPDPSPLARAAIAAIARVSAAPLACGLPSANPSSMKGSRRARERGVIVDARTSILDLEAEIRQVQGYVGDRRYTLRMSPDEKSGLLKEVWLGMLVASASSGKAPLTLAASGVDTWPDVGDPSWDDDDAAALSLPILQSLQMGCEVTPSRTTAPPLEAEPIRRYAALRRGGVLGRGGRVMRLVEFDPQEPVAPRLGRGSGRAGRFEEIVLEAMKAFEVGALVRGARPTSQGPRQSIVTFLAELHGNAHAYARHQTGVRLVRIGKHLIDPQNLARRAGDFPQLLDFISSLRLGSLNLIEASVSDFGPGILGGFLASDAGSAFRDSPADETLHRVLHEQLSSNAGDPNAGLGTIRALKAAESIGGFVSLRTGRHWLIMSTRSAARPLLVAVAGQHPPVVGTHWTLFYPDPLR